VQCGDLSTEKVVASLNIRWDLHVHSAAALIQVLGSPKIIISNPSTGCLYSSISGLYFLEQFLHHTGDQLSWKTLNHPVDPSAVLASETLDIYAITGP